MEKHVCRTLLILSLLFLSTTSFSQIHISGPQSGTLIDTTYIVDGDISVEAGDSLLIEPGARFLFNSFCRFSVQGYLRAVGNERDSIYFVPNHGSTFWNGIDVGSEASDFSLLEYCLITGSTNVGIAITRCNLTIRHCTISGNSGRSWGGGILCVDCTCRIANCVIARNRAGLGGGIGCFPGGKPYVEECLIADNYGHEGGGIHAELSSSPVFYRCTITRNHSEIRGGGACVMVGASHLTMINCTVYGNTCDEPYGGGINVYGNCKLHMVNSIVAGNSNIGVWVGELNARESIRNCDFYDNDGGDFQGARSDSLGIVITTNANGDSCDRYSNMFLEPLFVNAATGNFKLQESSPCIDAGDPNSQLDPDSTIADIGAFYYDQSTAINPWSRIEPPATCCILWNYPNPFNAATQISFSLPNAGNVELTVSNVLGQRVATLLSGYQPSGNQHIIWDARDVASGIYFARMQTGAQVKSIKMVLLK